MSAKIAIQNPSGAWAKRREIVARQIEKAALKLFLKRGVEGVTVEDIAAAAGISRRTFYRYFDTPDDILTAMPRRALQRICDAVRARPLDEPLLESFLAASRQGEFRHGDSEADLLSSQVTRQCRDAWNRAIGRMNPNHAEVYGALISERLRAAGKDDSYASIIAAGLAAIMVQVGQHAEKGEASGFDADIFENALRAFADAISPPSTSQETTPAPKSRGRKAPTK